MVWITAHKQPRSSQGLSTRQKQTRTAISFALRLYPHDPQTIRRKSDKIIHKRTTGKMVIMIMINIIKEDKT